MVPSWFQGGDLPPRAHAYDQGDVLNAASGLCLAIEIPDSRYGDFVTAGGAQLIADNGCALRCVLGPQAPATWRDLDLASHRVNATVGHRLTREGVGAEVLGDPRIALTRLANELSSLGITLGAGQIVTTGTCLVPPEIEPGDIIAADYTQLGRMHCRFADGMT